MSLRADWFNSNHQSFIIFMIWVMVVALVSCVAGKLEVLSFGARGKGTALLQVNASCIVIGNNRGELGFYSPKGQMVGELAHVHRAEVVGVESVLQDGRRSVIGADGEGTLAVWNEDGSLRLSIDLKKKISGISYSGNINILSVNTGEKIELYSVDGFEKLRSLSGDGTFRKAHFSGRKLYYMLDEILGSKIGAYDYEEDKHIVIAQRKELIVDFAVSEGETSKSTIIYLINSRNHLEILQFPGPDSPNLQLAIQEQQSLILQSNYTSVTAFLNNASLPIFAAIKSHSQLQFFTHSSITMFLQFNYDIAKATSTFNNSLLLTTPTDQVTLVNMYDHDEEKEVWIVVIIGGLLAVGLYMCCGDCCPGIIQKYVAERDRKEIQLELYKKRTELDNF